MTEEKEEKKGVGSWPSTDKTVLAIFIFEAVLLFASFILYFWLKDLMHHPLFMLVVKTLCLGISILGFRKAACGRWTSAVAMWVCSVIDIFYFFIWWAILAALDLLGCQLHEHRDHPDCVKFGGIFKIWTWACIIIWILHLVSGVILCVWACDSGKEESNKVLALREAQVKKDEARMQQQQQMQMQMMQPPVPAG